MKHTLTTSMQPADNLSPKFRGHIPELDALRAFGITMVIIAHAWPVESVFWGPMQLCWILMDCFFVMSGFFITGILLDTRSRPDYFRSFYVRRSLRILPIYYLTITAFTLLAPLGLSHGKMLETWGSPWWFFAYLGNIPTALTGLWPQAAAGSYVPLWSLQIEEQFYLLFPLLVYYVGPGMLPRVMLALAAVSPLLRLWIYWLDPQNTLVQYVLLPCRMEGLAFGALIAIRFRQGVWHISKPFLTVATVTWLAFTIGVACWSEYGHREAFNRTAGFLISSIACAHVIMWLITFGGSRTTTWLRLRPIQYVGKISYGAYLFHWPIKAAVHAAGARLGLTPPEGSYLTVPVVYVLTIFCAAVSWRLIESPLLSLKDRLAWSSREQKQKTASYLPGVNIDEPRGRSAVMGERSSAA